jgi:hypothetical protein
MWYSLTCRRAAARRSQCSCMLTSTSCNPFNQQYYNSTDIICAQACEYRCRQGVRHTSWREMRAVTHIVATAKACLRAYRYASSPLPSPTTSTPRPLNRQLQLSRSHTREGKTGRPTLAASERRRDWRRNTRQVKVHHSSPKTFEIFLGL